MKTNAFTKEIDALQRMRDKTSRELLDWKTKLAWFQNFNLEQANFNYMRTQRLEVEAKCRLQQAQQAVNDLEMSVSQLKPGADIGIDPRYWFSSARTVAKRQLVEAQEQLSEAKSRVECLIAKATEAAELAREIPEEIAMARKFDPMLAQSAIGALQATLDRSEPELLSLRLRSDKLDKILREPLLSLAGLEEELTGLKRRIARAEAFDSMLTNAQNGYERAKLHEQCNKELGESKPANVLRQGRGALRGVEDKIGKLSTRVDSLIRFAAWDIRHIVIDGNNLCYEGRHFLKLAALEALVPILAKKYKVTLIFDASIRRKLKLSTEAIEARFPQADQVHIVASKEKADETVLAVAGSDPHTFVLSNDRFIDYPEKVAVKEERVLRHEIVSHAAYIHDLQIDARFEVERYDDDI